MSLVLQQPLEKIVRAIAADHVFTNAKVVLADQVIEHGWVAIADGKIVEYGEGRAPERGEDLAGDLLMPGLIELHTDHLEAHYVPRPKVYWNPVAAVVSYDGQMAACGITTVFDSLRVWKEESAAESVNGDSLKLANAISAARDGGLLRIDHFLHLRCEVPMPGTVDEALTLIDRPDVKLMSLMDHTPGQRQFRDEEKLRTYYRGKTGGFNDAQLDELFAKRTEFQRLHADDNYKGLVELANKHGIALASHDDTTLEHVEMSKRDKVAIAEFPTTSEAATALHAAGIAVLMGAPNLVRGGSHSGNVAAAELAEMGCLDILSSDYVPSSLLMAALMLPKAVPSISLAEAVRTVTKNAGETVGLFDRGEIAAGKRADLIRVRLAQDVPVARAVWLAGERVS